MLDVGSTFENFRIEAVLGQGGMGRVYRAFDMRLERRVALKVLVLDPSLDGAARTEAAARMLREAKVAAALEHPNKISVFDLGEAFDTPYIAMEYIAGDTLRAYVGKSVPGWQKKLSWLLAAASALEAAHAAGIVHRDVKPENVMVRDDGVVKVLDFGIARRTPSLEGPLAHTADAQLTAEGRIVGTPAYMAPEQLAGKAVDGRADQFAWGVMAYELLTGALPWSSNGGPIAMMAGMLSEPPRPLRAYEPSLPRIVDETIVRTLARAPSDRFPRTGDVIDVLEPFAAASARRGSASRDVPPTSPLAATVRAVPSPRPDDARSLPAMRARLGSGPALDAPSFGALPARPPSPISPAAASSSSGEAAADRTRISGTSTPARITGSRMLTSATPLAFAVDAEQRFSRFPPDFTVKGMFFSRLIGHGARFVEPIKSKLVGRPRTGRYLPFADYPQVDFSRICHAVATGLHPDAPVPEAMRRLGRQDFVTFAGSAVGRVSLALMRDVKTAILRIPDSYAAVLKGGTVTARALDAWTFEMVFRDFYGWVDCYPLGQLEGLVEHFGGSCIVEADIESAVNAVYRITLQR